MKNLRKYFPHIQKRDHVEQLQCNYVAVVNGHEHMFNDKTKMVDYLTYYRENVNEIRTLELYRINVYSLLDASLTGLCP